MSVYFDHAAAQLTDCETVKIITDNLQKYGANAESRHYASYTIRDAEKNALSECIKKWQMPKNSSAVFFSSGSEIFRFIGDFLNTLPCGNIVANAAMHPAFQAMLKRSKHEVRMVNFSQNGELDLKDLQNKCDSNTRFFAHYHVHNETGLISDIENIFQTVKNINSNIIFFADTIQSFGKMPLPSADLWSASGHKIGIAASAALFFKKNTQYDFEQTVFNYRRNDYLMGRAESALIISMLEYAAKSADKYRQNQIHCRNLQNFIRENLPSQCTPTFPTEKVAANILHLQLPPFDGAVIAGLLSKKNIAVSPGSACTAEAKTPSAALSAMHIKNPYSVLRLSFAPSNTLQEAEEFCTALADVLKNY